MSASLIQRRLHTFKLGLQEHYRIINSNPLSRFGFRVIVIFVLIALFAPWIAPHEPWEMVYDSEGKFAALRPPSWEFPVGTTHLGYDLFSQLILATRTTLIIGSVSGIISIVIGANVGLLQHPVHRVVCSKPWKSGKSPWTVKRTSCSAPSS